MNNNANNSSKEPLSDLESFEDFLKKEIEEGFRLESGQPIKCECGCIEFKQVDKYYGEGHLEEYALECTNENCLKIVGRWSYGSWLV